MLLLDRIRRHFSISRSMVSDLERLKLRTKKPNTSPYATAGSSLSASLNWRSFSLCPSSAASVPTPPHLGPAPSAPPIRQRSGPPASPPATFHFPHSPPASPSMLYWRRMSSHVPSFVVFCFLSCFLALLLSFLSTLLYLIFFVLFVDVICLLIITINHHRL